jgi:hypothetical protein
VEESVNQYVLLNEEFRGFFQYLQAKSVAIPLPTHHSGSLPVSLNVT